MLVPRVRYLDVRASDVADQRPIADSVNIPLAELPERMHELPGKHQTVLLAGDDLSEARRLLVEAGRQVDIAQDWTYGTRLPGRLWEPNGFLLSQIHCFPPGRALDLACGSGREAVALAANGWNVVAIDVLPDALEKGRDLARRYLTEKDAKRIRWIQMDLEHEKPLGSFDLVTTFFYLDRELLRYAATLLTPGGRLMVETFTRVHREALGKPRRQELVLDTNELPTIVSSLQVEHYEEGWRNGRHTARGLFLRVE